MLFVDQGSSLLPIGVGRSPTLHNIKLLLKIMDDGSCLSDILIHMLQLGLSRWGAFLFPHGYTFYASGIERGLIWSMN